MLISLFSLGANAGGSRATLELSSRLRSDVTYLVADPADGLATLLLANPAGLRPPTIRSDEAPGPANLAAMYASMVGLTLANPPTILSFAAVFAGLGLVARYPLLLAAGVMLGSALWWLLLTGAVALVRRRIEPVARWIALGSGLLVAGFGAAAIVTVLFKS